MSTTMTEIPRAELERSLAIPPRETAASAVMLGLSEPFMIPYALALGASPFQAGLLTSVRNLILSLSQRWTADLVHRLRSLRRVVLISVAIQIASFIPLALLGLRPGVAAVAALILCYTIGSTSNAFGGPAWASLVAGYLGPERRGAYFGRISRIVGFAATLATLAGGGILQLLHGHALLGFGLLMAGAAIARTVSYRLLARMAEGPWEEAPEAHFSFLEFIRPARTSNFVHFTLAISLTSFGVNVATPFFAVWVLEELHDSYFVYALTQLAVTFATALVVPAWGRVGDRFGHQAVLRWTGFAVSVLPLLWPLFPGPAGLVAIGLATGVVGGGYNLSMLNFVFDAVAPARRARSLSYFNLVNGVAVSLGALAGGWALGRLPETRGSAFVTLFLISGVLRFAGALLLRFWVREVKPVTDVAFPEFVAGVARMPVSQVLSILEVWPTGGARWRRRRPMR